MQMLDQRSVIGSNWCDWSMMMMMVMMIVITTMMKMTSSSQIMGNGGNVFGFA